MEGRARRGRPVKEHERERVPSSPVWVECSRPSQARRAAACCRAGWLATPARRCPCSPGAWVPDCLPLPLLTPPTLPTSRRRPAGQVFGFLRKRIPSEETVNEVKRMTLTKDGKGAVFDVPIKMVEVRARGMM